MFSDSKVRGANMGPTWVLSAPDGPHVGPMNLLLGLILPLLAETLFPVWHANPIPVQY